MGSCHNHVHAHLQHVRLATRTALPDPLRPELHPADLHSHKITHQPADLLVPDSRGPDPDPPSLFRAAVRKVVFQVGSYFWSCPAKTLFFRCFRKASKNADKRTERLTIPMSSTPMWKCAQKKVQQQQEEESAVDTRLFDKAGERGENGEEDDQGSISL